jgi:hypothetical protein
MLKTQWLLPLLTLLPLHLLTLAHLLQMLANRQQRR